MPVPRGIDWICISPKAGSTVVQTSGDELKLVWPQSGSDLDAMAQWTFTHHLIQPMDPPGGDAGMRRANEAACITVALADPRWRLSLQTHKLLGLA